MGLTPPLGNEEFWEELTDWEEDWRNPLDPLYVPDDHPLTVARRRLRRALDQKRLPTKRLHEIKAAHEELVVAAALAVREARQRGGSWGAIGAALGMDPQSAWESYYEAEGSEGLTSSYRTHARTHSCVRDRRSTWTKRAALAVFR
jgi:hypothetical protein